MFCFLDFQYVLSDCLPLKFDQIPCRESKDPKRDQRVLRNERHAVIDRCLNRRPNDGECIFIKRSIANTYVLKIDTRCDIASNAVGIKARNGKFVRDTRQPRNRARITNRCRPQY